MKPPAILAIALFLTASVLFPTTCHAGSVGPNAGPYFATTSVAPFVDITGTGTRILAHTDDVTSTVNLGFSFSFMDAMHNYTSAWVSSNGVIGFGTPNASPANVSMTASGVGPVIAPLWDDWQFVTPGTDGVYYQTSGAPGDEALTVEWHNAGSTNFMARGLVTFEATLYATGNVLFSYGNTNTGDYRTANGASATVGVAGSADGQYVEWSNNQGVVGSNSSVLVDPPLSLGGGTPLVVSDGDEYAFGNTAVPEPSTILMLGVGIAALLGFHRKIIS